MDPVLPDGTAEAHLVDQWRQPVRQGAVVRLAPLVPVMHQAGQLDAQVLGHRRLRDGQMCRRLGHAALLADRKQHFELAKFQALPDLIELADGGPPKKL